MKPDEYKKERQISCRLMKKRNIIVCHRNEYSKLSSKLINFVRKAQESIDV